MVVLREKSARIRGRFSLEPVMPDTVESNTVDFEELESRVMRNLMRNQRVQELRKIQLNMEKALEINDEDSVDSVTGNGGTSEVAVEAPVTATPVRPIAKRRRYTGRTLAIDYDSDEDYEKDAYFRKTPEFKTRREWVKYNTKRKLWRVAKKLDMEDRQHMKENPMIINLNHSPGCCEVYLRRKRKWVIKRNLEYPTVFAQ